MDIIQRSVEIILQNQSPSGAYVACPNFPTYQYCWFRDGAFIAYAMDLVGQVESAARFHAWAARVINTRAEIVECAVSSHRSGGPLSEDMVLHTRYTLEGEVGLKEEWPNFQLDGFGTWLWALEQHQAISAAPLPADWRLAAARVASYLAALWAQPCFDCWEEHPDAVHPYTLGAIYAGLTAQARLSQSQDYASDLAAIRDFIEAHNQRDGHFVKFPGQDVVDASLLGLAIPYGVFAPDDPRIDRTVARIEADLRKQGGGVHRYAADSYYGGGEWVLLAAWLGWRYAQTGQPDRARDLLAWCLAQAGPDGSLPEQVHAHLNDPAMLAPWQAKWGPAATPLLWSHAMLIVLDQALDRPK